MGRILSSLLIPPLLLLHGCDPRQAWEVVHPHRHLAPNATVASRVRELAPDVQARILPAFRAAGVPYPPQRVALLVLKEERQLQLYAMDTNETWRMVKQYRILAASGKAGPKLREGDSQVPEGIYEIDSLNPNSSYHVALHVSYPNAFDRQMAQHDGRSHLGGDIMIHGNALSIGCIAVGDIASEELFTVVALTGLKQTTVLSAPRDLRRHPPRADPHLPLWTKQLYQTLAARLAAFPPAPEA